MPTVGMIQHSHDGSGKQRKLLVKTHTWKRLKTDLADGVNVLWMYVTIYRDGSIAARATVYEDKNPYRKVRGRLYRWNVFPGGVTNSYASARGECMSLAGAKIIAALNAQPTNILACKPYDETKHRK